MRGAIIKVIWALLIVSCYHSEKTQQNTETFSKVDNAKFKTYECEQFSISYPNGYYAKQEIDDTGSGSLFIGRDSLDDDMTYVFWKSSSSFSSNARDVVTIFASQEIDDFKEKDVFYDIMEMDSTFTIDGYPTYSISSIYTEGEDTIIQSRTGLILPQKLDLMIVQRANTKSRWMK